MVKKSPVGKRHQMLWRGGGREKRQMRRQRERRNREGSHREKGWLGRNHEEPERYQRSWNIYYCMMNGKETVGKSLLQHGHQTLYPLCPQRSFQTWSWWKTLSQCSSCELGGSTRWTGQTRLMGCGPVAPIQLQWPTGGIEMIYWSLSLVKYTTHLCPSISHRLLKTDGGSYGVKHYKVVWSLSR